MNSKLAAIIIIIVSAIVASVGITSCYCSRENSAAPAEKETSRELAQVSLIVDRFDLTVRTLRYHEKEYLVVSSRQGVTMIEVIP